MPNCIIQTKNDMTCFMVTNLSNAPIQLEKGFELTEWQLTDHIDPTELESSINLVVKDEQIGEIQLGDHLSEAQREELTSLLRK